MQRIIKGTAISGLTGIPDTRDIICAKVYRPLLKCSRDEILEYCKTLEYTENPNYDFLRNSLLKIWSGKLGLNKTIIDTVTFYSTNAFFGGTPITHRIVEVLEVPGTGTMYRVKGDANEIADEEKVLPENILGKVIFKVPQLGKIQSFLTSQSGWIIVILIPALCIISYDIYKIFRLLVLRKKLLEFGVNKK